MSKIVRAWKPRVAMLLLRDPWAGTDNFDRKFRFFTTNWTSMLSFLSSSFLFVLFICLLLVIIA